MNDKRISIRFALLLNLMLVVSLFLSACGVGQIFGPSPTPTATATSTRTPSPTATSTPTVTPSPTRVPTTTPAPLGYPAENENWKVTLVGVILRERIYPGGIYVYSPKEPYMILDLGVAVQPVGKNTSPIELDEMVVMSTRGGTNNVYWIGMKLDAGDRYVDPFSLGVDDRLYYGDRINVNQVRGVSYFRLIYVVMKSKAPTFIFRFQLNAPRIKFEVTPPG